MKDKEAQLIWEALQKVDEAIPPQDDLDAQLDKHGDVVPSDIDHHNQYMMDQDLLQPLHAAAIEAGAKDINDWMIQQIKAQGENWTSWFIDTVIRGDY